MTNKIIFALIGLVSAFVTAQDVEQLLTSETWNIAYTISEEGVRTDEPDEDVIRGNWVKFNPDGTFETPDKMSGRNKGSWVYHAESNAISFTERGGSYKAVVEEISEMGLLLHYTEHGGFKIGLIHYVHIPKVKSNEETTALLTSGKWLVSLRRYDNGVSDKTPAEQKEDTWYEFLEDNTYRKSEFTGGETPTLSEGTWFLDEQFQLNLDASESSIYTVVGDQSKLILTTVTGGYNTIEMVKSK